jgi:hypothetical protein
LVQNWTELGNRSKSSLKTASASMLTLDDSDELGGVANKLSPSRATVAMKNKVTARASNSKLPLKIGGGSLLLPLGGDEEKSEGPGE